MTALCAGRDPEWWSTGDAGNRLAVMICGRCTGCPDDDPTPHGVIRRGVAYSDAGNVLPPCSICGAPNLSYPGGPADTARCSDCAEPRTWLPDAPRLEHRWIAALARRGMSDEVVAEHAGRAVATVARIRRAAGIDRRLAPALPNAHPTTRKAA